MNRLFSVLAARLATGSIGLLLLLAGRPAIAQLPAGCPYDDQGLWSYENPLYERWLSAYDLKYYLLELGVDNQSTNIEGVADILLECTRPIDTLVFELQDALEVKAAGMTEDFLDESSPMTSLEFEHSGGALYLRMPASLAAGSLVRIRIKYGGKAGNGSGFFSGLSSKEDWIYGYEVTYTLSEPHNASDWFPAKQVLEDKIDSVSIRLRCDKDLMAASNGLLVSTTEEGKEHVFRWDSHYPMAYYLLSFAVADYRDYSFYASLSGEGDSVLVQNYIYDDDRVLEDWEDDILKTGELITVFSKLYTDYPFSGEKYGHAMAPMGGGMEHQTMTTLQDFDFHLVAHELAHQWFGDHVTCGNWQDIWINEGFASYSEYIASQEILGQEAADAWMENAMSIALREEEGSVFVPESQVDDTGRLFSYSLSYKKGAILLHMIRFILDDDRVFYGVLREYVGEYGAAGATGEEFRKVLERISGKDFSCFFEQWYYGEGYPRFEIHWSQRTDSLIIEIEQAGSAPSATPFFRTPFEMDVLLSGGEKLRVRFEQTLPRQDFVVLVEGRVEQVLFDPEMKLLKTATVIQKLPTEKPYLYGPNPVAGELFLQYPNSGQFSEVRITSLSGQEMIRLSEASNPLTMDLSSVAAGPYLLEFTNNRGTFVERIVKVNSR